MVFASKGIFKTKCLNLDIIKLKRLKLNNLLKLKKLNLIKDTIQS